MRIGLLGGTFNPVHEGHLLLAEGAREVLGLDRVLWIPARLPPHKSVEGGVSPEDRARMVELAIQDHPAFSLSRIELDRSAPSYTVDTVRALQSQPNCQNSDWFFLVGVDTAVELPTWRQIDQLMKLVRFVAIPRPAGQDVPLPEGIQKIQVHTLNVSASEIRQRVREGRSIRYLVPEPVRAYIEDNRFYRC